VELAEAVRKHQGRPDRELPVAIGQALGQARLAGSVAASQYLRISMIDGDPSQRVERRTDVVGAAATALPLPTPTAWVTPGWRTVLLLWNATTGTIAIANRTEQASVALPPGTNLATSQHFAIGAGRDLFAPTFDAAFTAIWEGPAVESVNLLTLSAQLKGAAADCYHPPW
jgi:hypothetical protein